MKSLLLSLANPQAAPLPQWVCEAIVHRAVNPLGPVAWVFKWLGRMVIIVCVGGLSLAIGIVTLGGSAKTWGWPFVLIGRAWWYERLVRIARQEYRRAMQLGDQRGWSDADIAAMIDVALVRHGVQAGPKLEDLSSIEKYFLVCRQRNSWLNSRHQPPGYGSGPAGPNRRSQRAADHCGALPRSSSESLADRSPH